MIANNTNHINGSLGVNNSTGISIMNNDYSMGGLGYVASSLGN